MRLELLSSMTDHLEIFSRNIFERGRSTAPRPGGHHQRCRHHENIEPCRGRHGHEGIVMRLFDYHLWEFTIAKRRYGLPMDEDWGTEPRVEAQLSNRRCVERRSRFGSLAS